MNGCSYPETGGTFVLMLLLDMFMSLMGTAERTGKRLFVQGPLCSMWTFELLVTAAQRD